MTVTVKANAKINLWLDVVGKRADGYHDILSVMQSVSLFDTLTATRTEKTGISLAVGEGLPTDERNLAVRAANAYFAKTGEPFGVSLTLQKRIPMAAGLGGGSADAAATLRALNLLDGERFSIADLAEIGAKVGADVPFCVFGGTALCKGIGERITPLESKVKLSLVVAISGEGVSTPAAFAALDAHHGNFVNFTSSESPVALMDALKKGDAQALSPLLFNRFEEVVERERRAVTVLKNALLDHGALAAQMSGSGPSVFGLFADQKTAERAAEGLLALGARAYACEMI